MMFLEAVKWSGSKPERENFPFSLAILQSLENLKFTLWPICAEGMLVMVQVPEKTLTLEAFLKLPETKPASEYINGEERSLLLYPSGKQPEYRQHEHDVLPVPDLVTNLQLTVGDVLRVHPSFAMSINA
jgi:hypothetical protein